MLVAAAVCPCPPLLVPEVASGAAAELDVLRDACAAALRAALAAGPDLLCVVGPGPEHRAHPAGSPGGFHGFGVDLTVRLGAAPDPAAVGGGALPALSAPLAVGAWLLDRVGWTGPTGALAVPGDRDRAACRADGGELVAAADRVALLVLGGGSARRTLKAPGYLDERAEEFDRRAAGALAAGTAPDPDPALAAELLADGRAPWDVLAGAAAGRPARARMHYDDAPYGVGYLVADWTL